jgi:hypothetical protein
VAISFQLSAFSFQLSAFSFQLSASRHRALWAKRDLFKIVHRWALLCTDWEGEKNCRAMPILKMRKGFGLVC